MGHSFRLMEGLNLVLTRRPARYHDEHCLFQWRKLQYALEKKMKYIDTKTANYKHSKHCADALQEGREPQTGLGQEVVLGFYRCHRTTW